MAKVGFVGLGVMGGGMTKRLLAAQHEVVGYNRTRDKAEWLTEFGLRLVDTPREVAEQADVVFSMVTNTKALDAVTDGADGILAGLAAGKVYVDMRPARPCESRPGRTRRRDGRGHARRARVGSVSTLEEGRLSIMVGGDEEAFERVEPICSTSGRR